MGEMRPLSRDDEALIVALVRYCGGADVFARVQRRWNADGPLTMGRWLQIAEEERMVRVGGMAERDEQ